MITKIPRAPAARFGQAAALLEMILSFQTPADAVMDRYFRTHRNMGSKDRAFAAETVYGCLRHRRELTALIAPFQVGQSPAEEAPWLVAAWLLRCAGWSARVLMQGTFPGDAEALVSHIRNHDTASFALGERSNLPDWLLHRLLNRYGEIETLDLAVAVNQPAPVDLRVNTLKSSREDVRRLLSAEGYECRPTPFSPIGLRRDKRGPLFNTAAFRDGLFELQDEGSQLVGLLLAATPGERIVDFCAGAGGKTLELAASMDNKGRIHACDVSAHRLKRMKPRLLRAGVNNVQLNLLGSEHDKRLKRFAGTIDAVLVDAPCSGTGTLRRNPDIKWRIIDLSALTKLQASILDAAACLLKPGGRLVYATCSLLEEENECIVDAFLERHQDFRTSSAFPLLQKHGVSVAAVASGSGALRLLPHIHGTDAFYAMAMQKIR